MITAKEPISEKRIQVSETVHKLVLSIAQDIVYVTSHGNIKSPKHVALPITVKSKTGSSEIVTLLNQFGHGISYSVLREAETAMAERQTQRQEAGSLLPSNAQRNVFATFGFDNSDLLEETLSGKGTTHATNGILVQRRSLGCSNLELDNEIQGQKNFKKRSFKSVGTQIINYPGGKKVGPVPVQLPKE